MEKIIIIGAGVAGLTAGIYGRMNGYETEIYEMHTIPGGECTAWKRGGYTFDNCIHWLMGSKPGTALNRLWREVGALDDTVPIINNEEFSRIEMDGRTAIIYRDLDRLREHFHTLSPRDVTVTDELCAAARALTRLQMPVSVPPEMMSLLSGFKMAARMLPIMGKLKKYGGITVDCFAARFRDPLLRQALLTLMPGYCSVMGLLMMLGSLDSGDSGYPSGGSLPFALRIEKRYRALGGKVFYQSAVDKILVEGGRAVGVRLADGTERRADWVVSCADGHTTLYRMLDGKYVDEKMQRLYDDPVAYPVSTTVQVSVGIDADLSGRPYMLQAQAAQPVDAGGMPHEFVGLKNYSFDKSMAPKGKSVVTALLFADFDWWKAKKEDPAAYRAEKERLAREVCSVIESQYPETKGKIQQVDVVTPMTYERYCNAWRGAWMSWMYTPDRSMQFFSGSLPGLERFYLSGQWTMPPGGLPGAVMTGKWVIQRICGINKRKFVCAA